MSAEVEARVRELLSQANALEPGPTQVAVAEEAVRLADTHGDVKLAYQARQQLIHTAVFSDLKERVIAPFTWCLAQYDRTPNPSWAHQLLWQYKWVIGAAEDWAEIPLDDLNAMFADMEARYRKQGYSLRAVYKLRVDAAMTQGDARGAREWFGKWQDTPRDLSSDCAACDRNMEMAFRAFLGEDERALEAAAPLLAGRMRCTVVPRLTYAQALLPLVRLGRLEEAMEYHRKGHRLTARNRKWVNDAAQHLVFLALTDNLTKGLRLLESHLPFPRDPIADGRLPHFEFALAARFLLNRLRLSGRKTAKLRFADAFPAHREGDRYEVPALEDWFDGEARRLAARFDARHGNDTYARRIADSEALHDLVTPHPLRPPGRDRSS